MDGVGQLAEARLALAEFGGTLGDARFKLVVRQLQLGFGAPPPGEAAADLEDGGDDEQDREHAAEQDHLPRPARARLGLGLALGEQPALGCLHLVDHLAQAVHDDHPPVGPDERHGRREAAVAPRLERRAQLGEPARDERREQVEPPPLLAVIGGHLPQLGQFRLEPPGGGAIGLEVALVAGQQEAALPGLGVLERREDLLELGDHGLSAGDLRGSRDERVDVAVGGDADDDEQRQGEAEGEGVCRSRVHFVISGQRSAFSGRPEAFAAGPRFQPPRPS